MTWWLLLPVVCAGPQPRTREEIVQAVVDRFAQEARGATSLADLCAELGTGAEETRAAAARVVSDAVTYRRLVPSEDGLILSAEEEVADLLFTRMRAADELDRLFLLTGRKATLSIRPLWERQVGPPP